jgi:hypothetical protein
LSFAINPRKVKDETKKVESGDGILRNHSFYVWCVENIKEVENI